MPKLAVERQAQPAPFRGASPQAFGAAPARAQAQLGEAVAGLSSPLAAMSAQRATRRAAEFEVALRDEANRLSLSNDLEGAPAAFEEARRRLTSEFRDGVSSTGIFDSQANLSAESIGSAFKHRNDLRAIEAAQNDEQETLLMFSDQLAREDDPRERLKIMGKADILLERSLELGIRDQAGVDAARRQFNQDAMGGILRRFVNEDPAAGIDFVNSDQFQGNEAQRQQWLSTMSRAHDSLIVGDRQREDAAEKAQEEARKAAEIEWKTTMIQKASTPGSRVVLSDVESADYLSPATREKWTKIAMGDGRLSVPEDQFNSEVWREDRRLARMGVPIEEIVLDHIEEGKYSRSIGESLIATSDDIRFESGRSMLAAGLETAANGGDGIQATKYAQAEAEYEMWVRKNAGKADIGEAESVEKAKELIRRADTYGVLSNNELQVFTELLPEWAPFDSSGALELDKFEDDLNARLDDGSVTDTDAGKWALLIENRRKIIRSMGGQ